MTMSPRLRRLVADHQQVLKTFAEHPFIRIVSAEGTPPEKYAVEYRVSGLVLESDGSHRRGDLHTAEIILPLDYPRRPPLCRMTSPVFHPNIDPQKICIGDHWSAGQTLPLTIVRIAEMIAFQAYNVQSPLNAKAAAWVDQHLEQLPLQDSDFTAGL